LFEIISVGEIKFWLILNDFGTIVVEIDKQSTVEIENRTLKTLNPKSMFENPKP